MIDQNAATLVVYAVLATICLLVAVRAITWLWNRFHPATLAVVEATEADLKALEFSRQQDLEEELPHCVCGEYATHLAPKLVRKRTDWLRIFFATAPRYKRVVPPMDYVFGMFQAVHQIEEFVFCETHAHVADAMMDKFIYQDIRAMQADTNEKIAVSAAGFEQEGLLEKIRASLTDTQKKAARRGQSQGQVRLIQSQRTGTDGVE